LSRQISVALIADRDVLGSGVPTTFFGQPAPLPPGPIELSLRTGAPVVPCFVLRTGVGRSAVHFFPPLAFPRTHDRATDLRTGLEALARALEAGIAMAPDQWFVLQPIWDTRRPDPRP
jgi:KDO2-lipid IV(A) lauroyltransferase